MLSSSASAFSLLPPTPEAAVEQPTNLLIESLPLGCGRGSAVGDGGSSPAEGTDRLECDMRGYHPKIPIFGPKKVSSLLGGFFISGMNVYSEKGADTS